LLFAALLAVPANVFSVAVPPKRTAAPGFRPVLLATLFAMALLAYMPNAACAVPGGAGQSRSFRSAPASRPLSASLPARAYEIDPGPAP